jgi:hypothetical protein
MNSGARIQPLILAGPSFRPAGTGTNLSHVGLTIGAGLQLRAASFRIEPQLRYTRWTERGGGESLGAPNLNQVEFIVGIDRPSSGGAPFSVFGHRLNAGLIAGLGLGSDFQTGSLFPQQRPEANSGLYGLLLEAPLAGNWALEVDGLYRPLHGTTVEGARTVRFAHLTWEFPVLAKYRLPLNRRVRPFVEGGPSFRSEGNLNLRPVSHVGATFGGGVEATIARVKVAPTLRYTHWASDEGRGTLSETRGNQTQLLLSVSF